MKIITVTDCKTMELTIFSEEDRRIEFIKKALEKEFIALIEEGLDWVFVSGQIGLEMWTAELVLDLKETYNIKIGIITPFEQQESRWPEGLQMKYQERLLTADCSQPIYQGPY